MSIGRPEPLVRFIDIRKSYDGKTDAVRALNLDVESGEFLTLLGPSGSGKTTTLTMLAGFEQPTAGRIFVGDEDITRVAVEKRGIGMVFQNYALFPNMSVAENVGFPLRVRRTSRVMRGGLPSTTSRSMSTGRLPKRGSSTRNTPSALAVPSTAKGQRSRAQMASKRGSASGSTAST